MGGKSKNRINDRNNFRGACFLTMGSRIFARVVVNRLRLCSEHVGLTDDNQNGSRSGRSTADATQIINRIEKDMEDLRRRKRDGEKQQHQRGRSFS